MVVRISSGSSLDSVGVVLDVLRSWGRRSGVSPFTTQSYDAAATRAGEGRVSPWVRGDRAARQRRSFAKTEVVGYRRMYYELTPDAIELG